MAYGQEPSALRKRQFEVFHHVGTVEKMRLMEKLVIFLLVVLVFSFLPSASGFLDILVRRLVLGVVVATILLAVLIMIKQAFEKV